MSTNSYKRYVATTIASDVSDETVAEILENQSELQGVDIAQNSLRVYPDAEYFANIIGYIGKPDQDELEALQEENEMTMRPTISWEKQVSNSIWRQVFKGKGSAYNLRGQCRKRIGNGE